MTGSWIHAGIIWLHIAGGLAALLAGTAAIAGRKGGRLHASAGNAFCAAMLVLGISAAILEPFRAVPGSPVGGILVCYFIVTAWLAARRRHGRAGWVEKTACGAALAFAGLMAWGGFTGATTPAGRGPIFALAIVCLLAGLGDLRAVLRTLSPVQRLSRHLWRMCFAFFVATGSFFLGQQDVLPAAMRGSPYLLIPAFAPFAAMVFWLVRIRLGRALARARLRPIPPPRIEAAH